MLICYVLSVLFKLKALLITFRREHAGYKDCQYEAGSAACN